MLEQWIPWILRDFSFVMFIIAIIFIIIHRLIKRNLSESEIVYRWIALFALGFTGIYGFILHGFFPDLAASNIGWSNSPFQFELAIADLAFGVVGVLSFNASYGFRLATVIVATITLWGDAAGHIDQMIVNHNYTVGNAGSWFWMDIVIPIILIISIATLKKPAQ
jgi:hypothetical protein